MGDKNCCPRSWDIGHKLGAVSIFLKYEGEVGHKADYCTHLDTRQLLGPGGMQALQARGNEGVLAMSGYSTLALDNGGDGSTGQSCLPHWRHPDTYCPGLTSLASAGRGTMCGEGGPLV